MSTTEQALEELKAAGILEDHGSASGAHGLVYEAAGPEDPGNGHPGIRRRRNSWEP